MMPDQSLYAAVVFAVAFACLYVAHSVGDHWVQSHAQALTKGRQCWDGRIACAAHVVTLTLTKLVVLVPTVLVLQLPVSVAGVFLGLLVDAVTHYLIDRRVTLERLAIAVGKGDFYRLGTTTVDANGDPAPHLGTGAYTLDQSAHHFFLGLGALIIAAVSA